VSKDCSTSTSIAREVRSKPTAPIVATVTVSSPIMPLSSVGRKRSSQRRVGEGVSELMLGKRVRRNANNAS
jgi:hypothetical protein